MRYACKALAVVVLLTCTPIAFIAAEPAVEPDPRVAAAQFAQHSHLGTSEEAYPEVKDMLDGRGAPFADFKWIHDQQKPLDITFDRLEVAADKDLGTAQRAIVKAVVRVQYLGRLAQSLRSKANTDVLVSKYTYCLERRGTGWVGVSRNFLDPALADKFLPKPRKQVGEGPIRVSFSGTDLRVEKLTNLPETKSTMSVVKERVKAERVSKRARAAITVALAVLLIIGGLLLVWRWRSSQLPHREERSAG